MMQEIISDRQSKHEIQEDVRQEPASVPPERPERQAERKDGEPEKAKEQSPKDQVEQQMAQFHQDGANEESLDDAADKGGRNSKVLNSFGGLSLSRTLSNESSNELPRQTRSQSAGSTENQVVQDASPHTLPKVKEPNTYVLNKPTQATQSLKYSEQFQWDQDDKRALRQVRRRKYYFKRGWVSHGKDSKQVHLARSENLSDNGQVQKYESTERPNRKSRRHKVTKFVNLKNFDLKVIAHQPNTEIDFTAAYYQNQDLPDKNNIDRMLKNINDRIKSGTYNKQFQSQQSKNQTLDNNKLIEEEKIPSKPSRDKKEDKKRKRKDRKKDHKKKNKEKRQTKKRPSMTNQQNHDTSGSIHELFQRQNSNAVESGDILHVTKANSNSVEQRALGLHNMSSTGGEHDYIQQKLKQENARAVLKNERMKLNQSLMMNHHHYKSSTNEGSRSGTFGQLKKFKLNSGSSISSPKSLRSLISSSKELKTPVKVGCGNDTNTGGVVDSEIEDQASSKSLFANSMSHSFNSFYEFRSQQNTNNQLASKPVNTDRLLSISSTGRSMFSTPLVEFDTLGQIDPRKYLGRSNIMQQPSPIGRHAQRQDSFKHFSEQAMSMGTTSRGAQNNAFSNLSRRNSNHMVSGMRRHNMSNIESFAEVVEEEKQEDDGCLNLRRRQARLKMPRDKNEFNKKNKRNRSEEYRREKEGNPLFYKHDLDCGDVSENEEEEISDSSLEKQTTNKNKNLKKGQTYSIGHLTKRIWTQKIYSDDFDADFETLKTNQKQRFKLGSVQNSAIVEGEEQSEIENPYFSDNSSSSQLTAKLRKFNLQLSRMLDKSDNDSSILSVRSVGSRQKKPQKLSHYNSNLNEPIEEVEDDKEDLNDRKPISQSIRRRRQATKHIDSDKYDQFRHSRSKRSTLMDNDPILEENENEVDDDILSENNFYLTWQNHKRYLLTQDEQLKLLNDDARSSTGFFERKDKYHRSGAWNHSKIGGGRHRRKKGVVHDGENSKMVLDPIEENKDDPNEEGDDHESISALEEELKKSKPKDSSPNETSPRNKVRDHSHHTKATNPSKSHHKSKKHHSSSNRSPSDADKL